MSRSVGYVKVVLRWDGPDVGDGEEVQIPRRADWVVDLGPDGGDQGGEIVAEGTPETVAQVARSYTGQFLRQLL